MAFYKTNDPEVVGAWNERLAGLRAMQAQGDALADAVGGKAVFTHGLHGARFAGVRLPASANRAVWTARDKFDAQRPRVRVKPGASEAEKSAHSKVAAAFRAAPSNEVSMDGLYASIGKSWGDFVFAGFGAFFHDGFVYIETEVALASPIIEILGSEYAAAKAAA